MRLSHHRTRRLFPALLALLIAAAMSACGGVGPNPPPPLDDVAATLAALGVDTSPSARLAPDGTTLDDDSAPLGGGAAFGEPEEFSSESAANPTMELVIARNFFDHDTLVVEEIVGAGVTPGGDIDPGSESILVDLSAGNDWVTPVYGDENQFQSLRDIAAGDLDGDGFDEIAAIYVDQSDDVLKLRVFEDDAAGYDHETHSLGAGADVRSLKLIALDADGDGTAELLVAISYDDGVELVPLVRSGTDYDLDAAGTISLPQELADSLKYVRLVAGQLDYDNGHELVVVVNEVAGNDSAMSGLATLYVYDDAKSGRAKLVSRSIQANVGGIVSAEAADVSVDDIDGDGLDEVVLAGATNLAQHCDDEFEALLIAYDDAVGDLTQLGASVEELFYNNCPAFNSWRRYFVFVATPDIDGDGVHEIAANQLLFDDFAGSAPFTLLEDISLPADSFLDDNEDVGQFLSVATMAYVAADVTGDGREDLMVYHQNRMSMAVWGLSAVATIGPADNGWAQLSVIETPGQHNSQSTARPLLVPANVDTDGPVLAYGEGSYELVFTEPILIAALAAAPCQSGIAQNTAACSTKFGQGTSSTVDKSITVSVKASVFVGVDATVNVPFVGDVGAEFTSRVTATASIWAGDSYTVEKTITYSAGSLEDGVVFTSVPYDVYRYEILSHPDPELVGKLVVIRIPREPVTMIAERSFFNDALPDATYAIAGNVFDHTPGDVASYPSVSRKNSLLSQHGGIEFGPSGVGQGGGETELEIAVSNEVSLGGSLGIEYEAEVKATSGVAFGGFSVGYGAEAALSITSGAQTTYTGTVGSIAASDYAANAYEWGIFTYVQSLGDQKLEVINYWVE
ncbi:MAG TPA: VCBS repeat-containing protein [Trueperaceae bacterium]|nr:VCBS repeat-containing protein [Trueperaceae bacterium]